MALLTAGDVEKRQVAYRRIGLVDCRWYKKGRWHIEELVLLTAGDVEKRQVVYRRIGLVDCRWCTEKEKTTQAVKNRSPH